MAGTLTAMCNVPSSCVFFNVYLLFPKCDFCNAETDDGLVKSYAAVKASAAVKSNHSRLERFNKTALNRKGGKQNSPALGEEYFTVKSPAPVKPDYRHAPVGKAGRTQKTGKSQLFLLLLHAHQSPDP